MSVVREVLGRVWMVLTTVDEPSVEVARLRSVSWFLDSAFRVPGTNRRVGADAVLGLVPGVGDVVTGLVSVFIIYRAFLLGVPFRTLALMLLNVAFDTVAGSVPVLGDAFDAVWKANERNVTLVERHVALDGVADGGVGADGGARAN